MGIEEISVIFLSLIKTFLASSHNLVPLHSPHTCFERYLFNSSLTKFDSVLLYLLSKLLITPSKLCILVTFFPLLL